MKSKHIEMRSGRGGTSTYISGTRVRVSDVAQLSRILESETMLERINRALPHLTPQQIEAALQYWRAHKQEIDAEIEDDARVLSTIPPAW